MIRWLAKNGIQTGVHYPIPCHLQPVFGKMEDAKIKLERTEQVAKELLSLPMYPGITEEDVAYVSSKIREFHETRH
jgi:dTDP-4-amino-4,6-dideoxygalactose transaminase